MFYKLRNIYVPKIKYVHKYNITNKITVCVSTATSYIRISNSIFIGYFLGSPRIYVTKPSTIASFVSISNKDFSNPTVSQDFSTDIHKHLSDDKVDTNNSSSGDWLKNSVALSLFGIFVLFFSVFVIAYIYLKCVRKALIAKRSKDSDLQVQYRSLSLDTRQPMRLAYEEPREQLMADSTFLSPVFSRNEGNEISSFQINGMKIGNSDCSRETTGGGHSLSQVPTYIENETKSSLELEQQTCHDYTEIAENGTESSNVSVGYGCKSHVSSNTESSTAMCKDVVYINTKSQLV